MPKDLTGLLTGLQRDKNGNLIKPVFPEPVPPPLN